MTRKRVQPSGATSSASKNVQTFDFDDHMDIREIMGKDGVDVQCVYCKWTMRGKIHNKKRNRLTPARAEKLVYVYQNNNAIRKFLNEDDAEKYEAEVMTMLHDEQCSSASEDE